METTTETSDMHTAKPSTSSEEGQDDLTTPLTISSEATVSQEDDFSQLKIKNTERSKRARRLIMSDNSDDDDTQNRLRKPSDSQYSSEDSQKNENANNDPTKSRTSSDSVYSSGEDKTDLVNAKLVATSSTQGSSRQDDSSQLKTKNSERSRRARRYPSTDSSDGENPSQKSPRKPSSSQGSSKDRRKNNRSKRSISNDNHISEVSDSSELPKKNKKIKNVKQSPNKSLGRKHKTPTKRKSSGDSFSEDDNDLSSPRTRNKSLGRKHKTPIKRKSSGDSLSEEDNDHSPPRTRNSKRRKKGRKVSPAPTNKASTSSSEKKKSSRKSEPSDASLPVEIIDDSSEEFRISTFMMRNVFDKYTKKEKKESSDSSSSDESDHSQVHTISSEDDSESQSRTASPSEGSSDESMEQTENKKDKIRRKMRQMSSSSTEEASTSKGQTSNRKLSSASSIWHDQTDDSQFINDGVSEEESDSKNDKNSKEESESSQVKEAYVSPRKYKNLKVNLDSPDDEKVNKLPIESPTKINNVHLLRHKYKELKPKVIFGSFEDVKGIIYNGKTDDDLNLPEFSQLLWQVVKNNIDPDKASLLVRAGVNVNLNEDGENSDVSENSILHVVAEKAWRQKYEQLALTLMSYGADINKINGEGNSVLWSAVKGGSVAIVEELMRRGVQIGDDYNRVLRLAAEATESHSHPAEILPLLIRYNDANTETRDGRASHALRCLVKADGDLTAMRVLLDYILPLNDLDDEGNTLLIRAVIDSKFEMVKLLLEYGANPGQKRRDGHPPLWFAAHQPTFAIAGLLIKYGASVNDCNNLGQYPIHAACRTQSLENIRLLMHFGAQINEPDTYHNYTPFTMVNHQNLTDVTKLIIQHLAICNFKNIKIKESDLARIRQFADFRKYYAECSKDLHRMKILVIYEDISVYSLFNCDAKKISLLIKNSDLIDKYHEMHKQIQETIPVYWPMIQKKMKIAWSRRDKLISIENAIKEASNNVLTVDVCEKIARLACYDSLIDDEMKEISSS